MLPYKWTAVLAFCQLMFQTLCKKFQKFSNMTKDSLLELKENTFDYIFLSKIPFNLSKHFENQWAVFGTSQPGQKRHLTTMSSMVAPSISLSLTDFTCSPIDISCAFLKRNFYEEKRGLSYIFCYPLLSKIQGLKYGFSEITEIL